ncbi:nardilysin-like [Arabidopsis lyrata subsp. lyrata]|uniref:nardilysin-like n=1 Tax=Arabidopsis lyrata subsp. lyrata TaxID=81972 RepID=UPI000A29E029|nr:nardilysin-like [Arabidopsis lyrata subsp. lyrata]XP_020891013.1 nardilysin-like [Arabidopsis lyrata subsp. lyrata]XP_020891014.1 nardilysin-like [Arabidopsis lyrata subsp. lyrata]|eukprot:XP_020891012.1 nardilysin-like [Arabidopsis lyrata subsp. lyrata]
MDYPKRSRSSDDDSHDFKRQRIADPGRPSKSFTLENGLKVFVFSGGEESSAAMTVRVGSFADPPKIPGLAHVIEHMLFRGSQKFRGENELQDYVAKYDGGTNARTEFDHTTFSFEVDPEHFHGALDRFAHLFINPLMEPKRLEHEIDTVDSEFLLIKYSDADRLDQILAHTSYEDHPFKCFSWGNRDTLTKVPLASLRESALDFFNTHYRASSMILVIVLGSGSGDLDKIQSSVTEFFRDIPKGISPYTPEISRPWDSGKTYFLQSVENNQRVMITWRIPRESHQQNKVAKYVMQLFSEEREGSLSFFLKEKGWIWSLEVYTGGNNGFSADDEDPSAYSSTSFGQLFMLVLELTNEGLEQEYVLINHVYEYLRFLSLNTPPPYLMKEQKDLQDMRFRFLYSDDRLIDSLHVFADRLSANMLWCDADHALSQCFSDPTCDHSEINGFIKEFFTPANMRMYCLVKTLPEKEVPQIEPWFGTSYIEKEIPESCIEDWVGSRFSFPPENLFMPSNENLHGKLGSDDENDEEHDSASEDRDNESVEMDDEEMHDSAGEDSEDGDSDVDNTIKISNTIYYLSGNSSISAAYFYLSMPADHTMNLILVELLKYSLCPLQFTGRMAYIDCRVSLLDGNKLLLQFDGLHEKFKDFISKIWDKIKSFKPIQQHFKVIKEKLLLELHPRDISEHAKQLFMESLVEEKCKPVALDGVTFSDIQEYAADFSSNLRVHCGVIFGSISEETAKDIANLLDQPSLLLDQPSLAINTNVMALRVERTEDIPRNAFDRNSLTMVVYEIPCIGLSSFFSSLMAYGFERQLKIVENLGYQVDCSPQTEGIRGICFSVISPQYKPHYLLDRIYSFIREFKIEENSFAKYKELAINSLAEGSSIWHVLLSNEYSALLDARGRLASLTIEEARRSYDRLFLSTSSRKRVEVCISSPTGDINY